MVLVKCRERSLAELSLLETTLENGGVGKGSSSSKSFGKEKIALRSVHLKAVVRKKMKLFQEASHLWLIFHSKTSFVQCICARVGNSHEFGSEKILPL